MNILDRYSKPEMRIIWTDGVKWKRFLKVEDAVLKAKVDMGVLEENQYTKIKMQYSFTPQRFISAYNDIVAILQRQKLAGMIHEEFCSFLEYTLHDLFFTERIREIEKITHHDFQAFVEAVQENLPSELKHLFHKDTTTFDTQEPALAIAIIDSIFFVLDEIDNLIVVLKEKARMLKDINCIERSHGQWAEPDSLGRTFLWGMDALERAIKPLMDAQEDMRYSKISGAIGTYSGNLSPELERRALEYLKLKPAKISKQIILRDRIARVLSELANIAGIWEHITSVSLKIP